MGALLVLFAASVLEGGVWLSQDGSVQIQFTGLDFHMYVASEDRFVSCDTVWPVSDPQMTATCENGAKHRIYYDKDQNIIIFDDKALIKSEGEGLD
jgi:hypothetical protein